MRRPAATLIGPTLIGFAAVAFWSLTSLLAVRAAPVPPLQLSALGFGLGGAVGLVWIAGTGGILQLARVPAPVYAFGAAGLFGYHLLLFTALRNAPPEGVALIAYLWPLVVIALPLFGRPGPPRLGQIAGAAMGGAGLALVIGAGPPGALPGYALSLLAAVTWAIYAATSGRLGSLPAAGATLFSLGAALISAIAHLLLERTVWPAAPSAWLAVLALGLGPMGLATFAWDRGVREGDLPFLAAASHAGPLLTASVMIAAGLAEPTPRLIGAAVLIASGTTLAARAGLVRRAVPP